MVRLTPNIRHALPFKVIRRKYFGRFSIPRDHRRVDLNTKLEQLSPTDAKVVSVPDIEAEQGTHVQDKKRSTSSEKDAGRKRSNHDSSLVQPEPKQGSSVILADELQPESLPVVLELDKTDKSILDRANMSVTGNRWSNDRERDTTTSTELHASGTTNSVATTDFSQGSQPATLEPGAFSYSLNHGQHGQRRLPIRDYQRKSASGNSIRRPASHASSLRDDFLTSSSDDEEEMDSQQDPLTANQYFDNSAPIAATLVDDELTNNRRRQEPNMSLVNDTHLPPLVDARTLSDRKGRPNETGGLGDNGPGDEVTIQHPQASDEPRRLCKNVPISI